MQGTVKWFNSQKGYGFLVDSETNEDIFVHWSMLQMNGFKALNEDDLVEYEILDGTNGRKQAINVKAILTRKMIEDSLKEDGLHIQTMKDGYGVRKYIVINELDVIQTDEKGMTLMEVAKYAGFEISQLSA
ncbi:cold shock domain-containing protein [bacterium 0.1xD8-71]|nr:cold shock domain-containing protein [bacterium 0.1xD8-71]